jgi:arsenate reductase (thioredoxin)
MAVSAGTQAADRVHPEVVEVMKEIGIDVANTSRRSSRPNSTQDAHLLITMGCGDPCPFVPGLHRDDWALPDQGSLWRK